MKLKILIVGFISIITFISCNKTEIINPDDYDFSCYVDGKLIVPEEGASLTSSLPSGDALTFLVRENSSSNLPDAYIVKATGRGAMVYFVITNWKEKKKFELEDSHGLYLADDRFTINHAIVITNGKKYISKKGSGYITLNINDKALKNGTFEFTLYNENNLNDKIKVTKGKFDNSK